MTRNLHLGFVEGGDDLFMDSTNGRSPIWKNMFGTCSKHFTCQSKKYHGISPIIWGNVLFYLFLTAYVQGLCLFQGDSGSVYPETLKKTICFNSVNFRICL